MSKVRIIDVAREAGVSLGTVSNALNHPERVRPDTRRSIEEAIERLGYTPNQSARMLRGGHARALGIVVPQLAHAAILQVVNGANTEARRLGLDVLVAYADNLETQRRHLSFLQGSQMAGVIVMPVDDAWRAPANPAVPIVTVGAVREEAGWYVAEDHRAQGRIVATHLIARGCARIAVIGSARSARMLRRLEGIRAAAADRGVELEVLDAGDRAVSGDGYTLGSALATRAADERPDAIIGLTDVLAAGAIDGVLAAGLSVPGDVAIAGCDGNPFAWCGPISLTTCAPLGYELGRRAVQTLVGLIRERAEQQERAARDARTLTLPHPERSRKTAPARGEVGGPQYADGAPDADERDGAHRELVRPFLLVRESTVAGAGAKEGAAAIPERNVGAYL